MGEIDTKPIESVQAALSLFGEKGDQKKYRTSSSEGESEKDELQVLQKELANYKVQLEAKDSAHMQVLLKLNQYEERTNELSLMLMKSELERDHHIEECREAGNRADELESKLKEMANHVSETEKIREQLSHVMNELKATQAELLDRESELASAREMELKALTQTEMMEMSAAMEREKMEELLKQAEELGEGILVLKAAAVEAEKEKSLILAEKDAEIEQATEASVQVLEQLEDMKKRVELMEELENQLQAKSAFIESLQRELQEANELLSSSEKAASETLVSLENLRADLGVKERNVSDLTVYIEVMEMERSRLKVELSNKNENINHLNGDIEVLVNHLEEAKAELAEIKEKESDAQVEIALLKAELHKARSRLAAAEAAEARANSMKSGLYLAVQQLAVEAGEAKKENQRLRVGADNIEDEAEAEDKGDFPFGGDPQIQTSSSNEGHHAKTKSNITILLEEYESLIRKTEMADQLSRAEDPNQHPISENKDEVEALKKELEAAMVKTGEFRTRAEQAMSRAESAEKAKWALEDQLRKWREQKQRRKMALAVLRDESEPPKFNPPPAYDETVSTRPPLGKFLNMKF
ncbi:hypothetical protein CRG98_007471 [Punica granatum]|uniref:Protein WEAK CHLOROPLAST MOVEMENT UNDER BLUE LIGHT 1-like n=1 Tax=Punica granatum TaxID=22663 RepID=A0A2I0KUL2_PUNGR|nr:hypothetical protein CRG98_007471 [Punica granatum]